MSDTGETYFQFPLCALAFSDNVRERLECIISYSFIEAGAVIRDKMTPDEKKQAVGEFASDPNKPFDFCKHNTDHVAAMIGAQRIGILPRGISKAIERRERLRNFIAEFTTRHGRDPEVRIAKRLVFEARDGGGISYRELSVLAALYSIIGAKAFPVRVTRDAIRCRALGYKSKSIMEKESSRADGASPLSLSQINRTLDKLAERKFFARARANERQTFYSHRLTQDQIEEALIKSKTYSEGFHQRRLHRDALLMAKIKQAKSLLK